MKRKILLLIPILFLIPLTANAKSNYLYDVLKDEAENNGLALKYTGNHHDSFTEEPSKDIYHWYAQSDANGTAVLDKNNVIFNNTCWQILRTTDTGGVKLIYNGDLVDNKCLNTRGNHISPIVQKDSLYLSSNSYYYGTDYTYNPSTGTFQLSGNIIQSQWSSNSSNLISKYTCQSTSSVASCSTLYYIKSYYSASSANVDKLISTNYAQIAYNAYNASNTYHIQHFGYKYNKTMPFIDSNYNKWGSYGWSDSVVLEKNDYINLTNDATYPFTFDTSTKKWTSTMHDHSKNASISFKVAEAGDYIIDYTVSSEASYDYAYFYKNNTQLKRDSGTVTSSITLSNLTTSDVIKVQYQKDSSVSRNSDNVVFSVKKNEGNQIDERYLFGNSITYSGGQYHLVNTIKVDGNSTTSTFSNYHYTCLSKSDTCTSVYYIVYFYSPNYYFIPLSGGQTIKEYIDEVLTADNVNKTDSNVKQKIDTWYQNNMLDYDEYIEDTIFCNDRTVSNYGPFNPNGGKLSDSLIFVNNTPNGNLKCNNQTDQFSTSNEKAKLTYKVGLPTMNELYLLNNSKIRYTNINYWTMTPNYANSVNSYMRGVMSSGIIDGIPVLNSTGIRPVISLVPGIKYSSGDGSMADPYVIKEWSYSDVSSNIEHGTITVNLEEDVKEDTIVTFTTTPDYGYQLDGIMIVDSEDNIIEFEETGNENEYQFMMPDKDTIINITYIPIKSGITVEIVDETEDITIEIDDITSVDYNEEVNFMVKPVIGYKITSIEIIDEDGNPVEYQETDNPNEYVFTMPAVGVTIIPSYERVSNSVTFANNPNAKKLKIEVANSTAVVYEDTVRFIVVPEDDYELERIEIKDEEDNEIEYRKTDIPFEYEFIMPATNVIITPFFKHIVIINPETNNHLLIIILISITSVFTFLRLKQHHNFKKQLYK